MENIDSPKFRLFSLPRGPLRNVFRITDLNDTVAISLCSHSSWVAIAKLKLPVKAIKKKVSNIVSLIIFLTDTIGMRVDFIHLKSLYWMAGQAEIHLDRRSPTSVQFKYGTLDNDGIMNDDVVLGEWVPEYSYIDWMEHFLKLFDVASQERTVFEEGSERFNIVSVKKALERGFNNTYSIANALPDVFHQRVHRDLHPIQTIMLDRIPYPNRVDYHRLLLQNFECIVLENGSDTKLDTLLLTNAFSTSIWRTNTISSEDINRYLKLWKNGSSPTLEFLYIEMNAGIFLDVEAVLRGLKLQKLPDDREELFESVSWDITLKGGYQIWSKSGKRANISFRFTVNHRVPFGLEMCVFH